MAGLVTLLAGFGAAAAGRTPFTGHTRGVLAVATAQLDGRPVVISGSNDKTVRVWDLAARTHS